MSKLTDQIPLISEAVAEIAWMKEKNPNLSDEDIAISFYIRWKELEKKEPVTPVTVLQCAVCLTMFDDEGKDYPAGVFCPECKKAGRVCVGVCHKTSFIEACALQDARDADSARRRF